MKEEREKERDGYLMYKRKKQIMNVSVREREREMFYRGRRKEKENCFTEEDGKRERERACLATCFGNSFLFPKQ
jgi:hypothetical protein